MVEAEERGSHSPQLLHELASLETQILSDSEYVTLIPSIFSKISNILHYRFSQMIKAKCKKNELLLCVSNSITKPVTWDSQNNMMM